MARTLAWGARGRSFKSSHPDNLTNLFLMENLSAVKMVVFDFDDTLVQTKSIRYEALKYTGKHFYNLNITSSDIDRYWGKPFYEMMEGVFNKVESGEQIANKYKSILHLYPNQPFFDTVSTLKMLKVKYKLALVSSSVRDLVFSGMENVGIPSDTFDFIQTSDQVKYHKPDSRVFTPLIEFMRINLIEKDEALYVGDSVDDFISSTGAGLKFIGIAGRTTSKVVFDENGAVSVTSLSGICELLGLI